MNNVEVIRATNGKVKSIKIDGTPIYAQAIIVEDGTEGASKVTIIMNALASGHTE